MTNLSCAYCEETIYKNSKEYYTIRDGKKILYFHEKCIPFFSGGWGVENIEKKCGVEIIENCRELALPPLTNKEKIFGPHGYVTGFGGIAMAGFLVFAAFLRPPLNPIIIIISILCIIGIVFIISRDN